MPNLTQDREHAGDGRRGRTVGGGQPEAERPHADLYEEGNAEHCCTCLHQDQPIRFHVGHAQGEVCHVERACRAVDQADPDREEQGSDQIDGDVVQADLTRSVPVPCSKSP